jgi:hypothetical protein
MYQIIIYTPIIIVSSLLTKINIEFNPENDFNSIAFVARTLFLFTLFVTLWCFYFWFNPNKDKTYLLNKFFDFTFFTFIGFSIGLQQVTYQNNILPGGLIQGDMGRIISWSINFRDEKVVSFYSPLVTSGIGFIDQISNQDIFEVTKMFYVMISISIAFFMYFLANKFLFEKMGSLFLILILPTFFIDFKIGAVITMLIIIHIVVSDVINDNLSKRQRFTIGLIFGLILLIDYSYFYWFFLWIIFISIGLFFNKQREKILDRLFHFLIGPSFTFLNILILYKYKNVLLNDLLVFNAILFLLLMMFVFIESYKKSLYFSVLKIFHLLVVPLSIYIFFNLNIDDKYLSSDVNNNMLPSLYINTNNSYYIIIILSVVIFMYANENLNIDNVTLLIASQILSIILMYSYIASKININGSINLYPRGIYLIALLTNYILILILLRSINFEKISKFSDKNSGMGYNKSLVLIIFLSVMLYGKFNSSSQTNILKDSFSKSSSTDTCANLPKIDFEYAFNNFKLYIEAIEACENINYQKLSIIKFSENFGLQENDNVGKFVWALNPSTALIINGKFQKSITIINPPCIQSQNIKIYINETETKILNLENQRPEILNISKLTDRIRFETKFQGCTVYNDERKLFYKIHLGNFES